MVVIWIVLLLLKGHQGDPISLYLFVLCMEKFTIYINQLMQENKWIPIHLSSGGPGFVTFSLQMMYCYFAKEGVLRYEL